ncbi:MAG: MMPL family transporter [candidate division Zixibacteria bacterium]|nr:MMPL family transporter [candidate division Zixibacteria bacterium]
MFLPKFAIKRPVMVSMIFLILIILGGISFVLLPIDLFPDIDLPMVMVVASYEGAGPSEIESMVARPLEMSLAATKNLKNIYSYSLEEACVVMAEFDWGSDMDVAAADVREKVDMVRFRLPEGVESPSVIKFDPSMMPIMFLGFAGEGLTQAELRYYAEETIQPRLERLDGVAAAFPIGGLEREIKVQIDRTRLEALGLAIDQVIAAIGASNLDLPGGHLKFGQKDFLVRTTGQFTQPSQLENVIISSHQGIPIRLKDVATVKDGFKEQTSVVRVGGGSAIVMLVQKESQANTVLVADKVKQALESVKRELPAGIRIDLVWDSSDYIKHSVGNVERSALEGGLLAIIIILIFLRSFSSTLIISVAIPVSVVVTFVLIYFGKMTLNITTLGGLALGIGRLVDDAIVVLENIFRHRQRGERPKEAAVIGASEVSTAVLAATATTIIVFVPIFFVRGMVGVLFRPMGYTVVFSLAASYFVAMILIPLLASRFLKVERVGNPQMFGPKGKLFRLSQRMFDAVEDHYQKTLSWAITHKKTVILGVIAALLVSLPLLRFIGAEFMPQIDEGRFEISLKMPVGTELTRTEQVVAQMENIIIQNVPELNTMMGRGGIEGEGFAALSSIFQDITGSHAANMEVSLVERGKRERSMWEIMEMLRHRFKEIPDAEIHVKSAGLTEEMHSFGGAAAPIVVEIRGYEMETAGSLAQEVKRIVEQTPGSRDVRIMREEGLPELQIKIDRDKAAALGLSVGQIGQTIQTNVRGTVASLFRDPRLGKEYNILVQLRQEDRESLLDLDRMFVTSPLGSQIPLSSVAEVVKERGPVKIDRKNQERTILVTSQAYGRAPGTVAGEVQTRINRSLQVPDNFFVDVTGAYEDQKESFRILLYALILAVVLIYMVLAAQFESLLDPFIVMFSVPLGIIGVIWGLFLTGKTMSILSFVGMIMMAGIVVSNAILLVDYANILRRRGLNLHDAVVNAGRIRLRPILMTSFTTMLALVPMALGFGEGGEMYSPLAVAVISGLLISMALTLVFIPTLYTLFTERFKRRAFAD